VDSAKSAIQENIKSEKSNKTSKAKSARIKMVDNKKYMSIEEQEQAQQGLDFQDVEVRQLTDNYSDETMRTLIMKTKKAELLGACALQIAIAGFGSGNYGTVMYKNQEHEVNRVFAEHNIHSQNQEDRISEDQLTPRRLVRFFRLAIARYLYSKRQTSFLVAKHGTDLNLTAEEKALCFAGAEYLEHDDDIARGKFHEMLAKQDVLNARRTKGLGFEQRAILIASKHRNRRVSWKKVLKIRE
jgi:hypothetical protein